MQTPQIPSNEASRLSSLTSLNILDTPPEERFDRITRLAKSTFNVPIALVSLVDENRQWFKSCFGLSVSQTSREISFCGHAILGDDIFIIEDTLIDDRFSDNPLVTEAPFIRFYAGCPLKMTDGSNIGTLCIIDRKKRALSEEDKANLKHLARIVEDELQQVRSVHIDEETNVSNKAGLLDLADFCLETSAAQQVPLTLAELTIKVQSSLHEPEAKEAVKAMAEQFKRNLRDMDVFARTSPNKFVLLLPNCEQDEADMVLSAYLETVKNDLAMKKLDDFIIIEFTTRSLDPGHRKTKKIIHDL